MSNIPLEQAQANLSELLHQLQPGEEITITDHGQPLAQLKKNATDLLAMQGWLLPQGGILDGSGFRCPA